MKKRIVSVAVRLCKNIFTVKYLGPPVVMLTRFTSVVPVVVTLPEVGVKGISLYDYTALKATAGIGEPTALTAVLKVPPAVYGSGNGVPDATV